MASPSMTRYKRRRPGCPMLPYSPGDSPQHYQLAERSREQERAVEADIEPETAIAEPILDAWDAAPST